MDVHTAESISSKQCHLRHSFVLFRLLALILVLSYRLKENFDGSFNQQGVMKKTTEGIYIRHVKLPTGEVYEVSGLKGLKSIKAIQAFMFSCEEYKKEYESNPKYQTCSFEEAVIDYNVMCP